ncbi:Rne/Rng family ribonuclease [Actinomyces glycerinitolerans]|uniref:Ribonuclease E n=1 Tax=Actinomyces glycerinitolerans TaxID=1892869 RepID=A0A1M4RVY2_9ACTO|nr:Rne/Rng family ribonuclease [Actinomyces glycerinitolerans]SHE24060.1 ribonuclease e/g [Actinomyces glycerinitolerans]
MSPSSSRSHDSHAQGSEETDAPKRPARRHRRVTAAVTTPESAPDAPSKVPDAADAEAQEAAAQAEGIAAPDSAASAETPEETDAAAVDAADDAAQAEASDAAENEDAEDAADAETLEAEDVEDAEAAEAADAEAGESEAGEPEAAEAEDGDATADAEPEPESGADSDADPSTPELEEDLPEPEEPQLPAASLLFQAPDPALARRRRRKVKVAATTPAQAQPAESSPESASRRDRDAPAAKPDAAVSAGTGSGGTDASTDSDEAATGTRGGRRRRRRATAASTAPEHVEEAAPAKRRGRNAGPARDADEAASAQSAPTEDAEGAEDAEGTETNKEAATGRRKRRRGGRGRRARSRAEGRGATVESADDADEANETPADAADSVQTDRTSAETPEESAGSSRRRRRRSRSRSDASRDEITALKGSTRLEAKRQRRREGRAAGRRRPIITEAEFLARRESVDRQMVVREQDGLNQIAVLEDGLLVEHYVARHTQTSLVGNVYVGRVQNVLPSMEAAFVDIGKGRNAVLYAGEVNWDAAGMEGKPRRIEDALASGDTVLVQVTKDPIGHKGARLTSQITLAGRYLVLVPGGTMTGISRKLPDTERNRLKKILKRIVPDDAGVIVRTAAEGAGEEQLADDIKRLVAQWESIEKKSSQVLKGSGKAPVLLKEEPELAVRVVRDVFNEDFRKLIVQGPDAWKTISTYVSDLSPELTDRLEHWVSPEDVFTAHRIDEQLAKGFDRKVWLPSGGTLIIDRTEAMTVIDVNTGRFTGGADGTLEETITRNNLEAAEEIVRQLRLRDIGGMVVIDFVDMVLESNRDLVLRRLVECLGRDRTRHQVTEVTSLGLVQMTRKRVGQGLVEAFSTPCECCGGRGFIVHEHPVENQAVDMSASAARSAGSGRGRRGRDDDGAKAEGKSAKGSGRSGKSSGRSGRSGGRGKSAQGDEDRDDAARSAVRGALAQIAAAAEHAHEHAQAEESSTAAPAGAVTEE